MPYDDSHIDYRAAYYALQDEILQQLGPHIGSPKEIDLAQVCSTCTGGPCNRPERCSTRYASVGYCAEELLILAAAKLFRLAGPPGIH